MHPLHVSLGQGRVHARRWLCTALEHMGGPSAASLLEIACLGGEYGTCHHYVRKSRMLKYVSTRGKYSPGHVQSGVPSAQGVARVIPFNRDSPY